MTKFRTIWHYAIAFFEEYESFKNSVTSIVPKYFPEELKQRLNEFGEKN